MEHQISTVEGDGEEFNTFRINFGADRGRNFLLHFKHDQNEAVGDIVLLRTEVHDQTYWPVAKLISCETDNNGMVRAVKLRIGKSKTLRRQVDETVLLPENKMVRFPEEGSHTYSQH